MTDLAVDIPKNPDVAVDSCRGVRSLGKIREILLSVHLAVTAIMVDVNNLTGSWFGALDFVAAITEDEVEMETTFLCGPFT